ncbi:MAG: hypothetical protein ACHQRJ_16335 [Alphaproteobacteria bacterium]
MSGKHVNRRAFLLSTAGLGGVLALLSRSQSAAALSIEGIPAQSGLGAAYANRCSGDGAHAQILAKLESALAGRTGAPGSMISMTEYCPICGCPIIATRTLP